MKKVRFRITLWEDEADIIDQWKAAKGKGTYTELFRDIIEPAMKRSKVKDLHEKLIECRIKHNQQATKNDSEETKSGQDVK